MASQAVKAKGGAAHHRFTFGRLGGQVTESGVALRFPPHSIGTSPLPILSHPVSSADHLRLPPPRSAFPHAIRGWFSEPTAGRSLTPRRQERQGIAVSAPGLFARFVSFVVPPPAAHVHPSRRGVNHKAHKEHKQRGTGTGGNGGNGGREGSSVESRRCGVRRQGVAATALWPPGLRAGPAARIRPGTLRSLAAAAAACEVQPGWPALILELPRRTSGRAC